ncbi:uncharacterized protein LOC143019782 [Oratosquilla oratoria]|uniref:uncharacterized protein LOC143019781 n=1 Tax=Oratosquilla oratoria TaxID=337810 RepID=UPI003F777113
MGENGHGEGGSSSNDMYQCMPLPTTQTFVFSIVKRCNWEFAVPEANQLYYIPWDKTQFYTQINYKNVNAHLQPFSDVINILNKYGGRVLKCGVSMHSLIPMIDETTTEAGTTVERTTHSDTPYLEIFKDTNYQHEAYKVSKKADKTEPKQEDWNDNPQLIEYDTLANANYEDPLWRFAEMEQMHAGDRKAFTYTPDNHGQWYSGWGQTGFTQIPAWGGTKKINKPENANVPPTISNANCRGQPALLCRMTPVKNVANKINKFRCRVQADIFMSIEARISPSGLPHDAAMKTRIHQFQQGDMTLLYPFHN